MRKVFKCLAKKSFDMVFYALLIYAFIGIICDTLEILIKLF